MWDAGAALRKNNSPGLCRPGCSPSEEWWEMGSGGGGRATSGRCGNWVLKDEGHGVSPNRNFGKGSFRDRSLRPQETWQRHRRKKRRKKESKAPRGVLLPAEKRSWMQDGAWPQPSLHAYTPSSRRARPPRPLHPWRVLSGWGEHEPCGRPPPTATERWALLGGEGRELWAPEHKTRVRANP